MRSGRTQKGREADSSTTSEAVRKKLPGAAKALGPAALPASPGAGAGAGVAETVRSLGRAATCVRAGFAAVEDVAVLWCRPSARAAPRPSTRVLRVRASGRPSVATIVTRGAGAGEAIGVFPAPATRGPSGRGAAPAAPPSAGSITLLTAPVAGALGTAGAADVTC